MADGQIKVNFSTEEVESETRAFLAMPPGFYTCNIIKVEDASVQTNDKGNFGKPFWKVTLVVQEGKFAKRWLFTNIMLFEGALHTASQLLKSVGMGDLIKKGIIPNGRVLLGKTVEVNVSRKHDKNAERELRELGDNSPVFKNEVNGFRAVGSGDSKESGGGSILP